jgi:ATP adenylyltransferase
MTDANLWAPWRMSYLRDADQAQRAGASATANQFLAEYWKQPERDQANHVVHRDGHGLVLLNRYPYANGHLMAALGVPRPTLRDYADDQRAALWRLVEFAADLIERALNPQGINIGINQGKAAGAGVPEHLHVHLVPRWAGDTNFMTVVGGVRVIPDSLEAMAAQFRAMLRETSTSQQINKSTGRP